MIYQKYKAKCYYINYITYFIILILSLHYLYIVNKTKDYKWYVQILSNYTKKKVKRCYKMRLKNKTH